jgi:hypothetical protein
MPNLLAQADLITPDLIIPVETAILTTDPPPADNINCSFYNAVKWDGKPANKDSDFEFASSTCSLPAGSTASTTAGFTNGDIINGVFLFLILMVLGFDLFLKMLYPKK